MTASHSLIEPVKTRLVSLEAALTILKLSIALYPPGAWLRAKSIAVEEGDEGEKGPHTYYVVLVLLLKQLLLHLEM